jgi:hypothetical protein
VLGNLIGTDPSGTRALGNLADGVYIDGASNNTIGNGAAGERNVISGNGVVGIQIDGPGSSGNVVQGDFIGTDSSGMAALGNGIDGIFVNGAANNIIGGTAAAQRNIISGNLAVGIRLFGSGATGNQVLGNFIGTAVNGTTALGNADDGVYILTAANNIIGGTAPGAGNVISGNGAVGIQIDGTTSSGNVIQGNLIGTDVTGMSRLGNGVDGLFINAAPGNTVGGPLAGARNVISANGSSGVQLLSPSAAGNVVQGNLIGTDITGAPRLGNAYGIFENAALRNTIGGRGAAANTVAGNTVANTFANNPASGPSVVNVTTTQSGGQVTAIVIGFSAALDPSRAQKLSNYKLQQVGRFKVSLALIRLSAAVYNPITQTVTLTLAHPVPASTRMQLTVSGTKGGITDTAGRLLDGDNNGRPGSSYTTVLGPGGASATGKSRGTHPATQHGARIATRSIGLGRLSAARAHTARHR